MISDPVFFYARKYDCFLFINSEKKIHLISTHSELILRFRIFNILIIPSDLKMEASQPVLHLDTVSFSQTSIFIPPASQKETVTQDPASLSNSSEIKKAMAAIQNKYDLYKCHIRRYCKTLHYHGWDLQKALEELLKCSQKWKKNVGFSSGQIKNICERSILLTTLCLSVSFYLCFPLNSCGNAKIYLVDDVHISFQLDKILLSFFSSVI
jgi:hypothetical protein